MLATSKQKYLDKAEQRRVILELRVAGGLELSGDWARGGLALDARRADCEEFEN